MENLKIEKSKKALDLFFELGGVSKYGAEYKDYLNCDAPNLFLCDGYIWSIPDDEDADKAKEITLPQLEDMVVLKRNDVKDANVCQYGDVPCLYDLYLTESKDLYFYHCGKEKWILSNLNRDEHYYRLLKPIEKQEMKETLNDKVASAEVARQDNVNNPSHYNKGGVECIDAIQSSMTKEAFCGYLKGNIQKYVFRYENKGGVESLQKAQWYLNKLIEVEAS